MRPVLFEIASVPRIDWVGVLAAFLQVLNTAKQANVEVVVVRDRRLTGCSLECLDGRRIGVVPFRVFQEHCSNVLDHEDACQARLRLRGESFNE